MNFAEFLANLQKFTNNCKLRQADIARGLNTSTSNLSQKFSNPKSEVSISDAEKVQDYLGIKWLIRADNPDIYICDNTGERQNDLSLNNKIESVGQRYGQLQDQHDYLDKDMAKLLNISEDDYISIKCGDVLPNIEILTLTKQKFKVSVDWLLFGD